MKYFSFNSFGNESIEIEFDCNNCGNNVVSEEIGIPSPNYLADNSSDSQTEEEGFAICEHCGKQFEIYIYSTFAGGDGTIEGLPDNHYIRVTENTEPYYEDQYEAISSNTLFFETFKMEITNLRELNRIVIEKPSVDLTLRRQIFVGAIASLETYLSDAFINTTLKSEKFTRKFVESFHDFKNRSLPLNKLFDVHETVENICKQAMLEVIYHNLAKVKGMYKDTLNVDLGEIGTPIKQVLTRHDLVHRNGKDKEGKEVVITKQLIKKLFEEIENFVALIDAQIKAL